LVEEVFRVPRNIHRTCRHLKVIKNVGLVCTARNLSFMREWFESPCYRCDDYKRGGSSFGEIVKVKFDDFYTPKRKESDTRTYTINEIENSSKISSYEYKAPIEDDIDTLEDRVLYSPIDDKIVREKNGFKISGLFVTECCGGLFATGRLLYVDSDGFLYHVSDDTEVLCANGHHLSLSDLTQYVISEPSPYADNYFSFIAELKKNPQAHTRKPTNCLYAKRLNENLYLCKPNTLRIGEDALCCQTCKFWELKL